MSHFFFRFGTSWPTFFFVIIKDLPFANCPLDNRNSSAHLHTRDIFYPYPTLRKHSYWKVLLDSFIWYCGISKRILVTFFNIAHAVKLFTIQFCYGLSQRCMSNIKESHQNPFRNAAISDKTIWYHFPM